MGPFGPKSNYYKMKIVVENFCFNTLFTFNVENVFIFENALLICFI
jgi:hypothetical protein